jgi:hypothetical protein
MNIFIKIGVALTAIAICLGCDEKAEASKVYSVTLVNGETTRTFKIPGAYIQTKGRGERTSGSIWVHFTYPTMQPFYWASTPTKDSVALLIDLGASINKKARSEIVLDAIKACLDNPPDKNPARYLGKSGEYDLYEEVDSRTGNVIRTSFYQSADGAMVSFVDSNFPVIEAHHLFKGVIELRYLFPRSLQSQQLEIDKAIVKFVDSLLQS